MKKCLNSDWDQDNFNFVNYCYYKCIYYILLVTDNTAVPELTAAAPPPGATIHCHVCPSSVLDTAGVESVKVWMLPLEIQSGV